jgi:hypothetical protein
MQKILKEQSISKQDLIIFFRNNIVHVFELKVFGSAVMSMFSEIEPNDIDLYAASKQGIKIFTKWMSSTFGSAFCILQEQKSKLDYKTITKLLITIGSIELKIDIVIDGDLIHNLTSDFVESRLILGREGFELLYDPEIKYDKKSIPWLILLVMRNLTNKTLTISASHCIPGVSHLVHNNKFRILQRVHAKKVAGYSIKAIDRLEEWDEIGINKTYQNNGDWSYCDQYYRTAREEISKKPRYTKSMQFTDKFMLPGLECIVDTSINCMEMLINTATHDYICDDAVMIIMSYLNLYDPNNKCTYCDDILGQCGLKPHMKSMCLCDSNVSHGDESKYNGSNNGEHKGMKPRDPRNGILCKRGCNGCQDFPRGGYGNRGYDNIGYSRGGRIHRSGDNSQRGPYYDRTRKDENFGHGFKYYYNRAIHTPDDFMCDTKVFHFECFIEIADLMNPRGYGAPCNNICNDCYGRFIE